MAAGLGFKDFVTGEVLTAADVDGYLMQGVWVFASSAARSSAVTSPQEGNMSFLKDTNSLEYYDGAAWTAVSGGSSALEVFAVHDAKTSGTDAGAFTSGAWRTRTLNTTLQNTMTGASLSSNQITLPAGTFYLQASAPAFQTSSNNLRWYNITDSTSVATGTNSYALYTNDVMMNASLNCTFTIAANKTFELQHYGAVTKNTSGFGVAGGLGYSEIYAQLTIIKVG